MSVIGIPVVSASIVPGTNPAVPVSVGESFTVNVQNGASTVEYTGTVLAIELMNKPYYGAREHAVYDGVPTSAYNNPAAALVRNAADVMEVNALVLEVTEGDETTHVRIPVARIQTIVAA